MMASTSLWLLVVPVICIFITSVDSQSMDPRVNITETDPPSDGYLVRGYISKDVTLSCYVENKPVDLDVRWQKTYKDSEGNDQDLLISRDMGTVDNMKYSIEKPTGFTWRLRIKALELHDEAVYTCFLELTGNNNQAASNRTVLAYDPPLILEAYSSNDQSPQEGDFVPLRCNASGRPYPNIMWRREGNAVLPGGGTRVMGPILDIENIPYDARGRYICEAFNIVGYDRRDVMLDVEHAPKVSSSFDEVQQAVGYRRTLVCSVQSNPTPRTEFEDGDLIWIKGNIRVFPNDRLEQNVVEGAWGKVTLEMIIHRVERDDFGSWRCQAQNVYGTGEDTILLSESSEPLPDKKGEISSAKALTTLVSTLIITAVVALLHSL